MSEQGATSNVRNRLGRPPRVNGNHGRSRKWRTPLAAGVLVVAVVVLLVLAVQGRSKVDPQPTLKAEVWGTCMTESGCGLVRRDRPSDDGDDLGRYQDGDQVELICQTDGDWVEGPGGSRSKLWDKTVQGEWVSDLFLDTDGQGGRSRDVPGCLEEQL